MTVYLQYGDMDDKKYKSSSSTSITNKRRYSFNTMEEEEGGSLPFLDVTSTEGNKWQLANICLLEAYSYQQVSKFPFQSSP